MGDASPHTALNAQATMLIVVDRMSLSSQHSLRSRRILAIPFACACCARSASRTDNREVTVVTSRANSYLGAISYLFGPSGKTESWSATSLPLVRGSCYSRASSVRERTLAAVLRRFVNTARPLRLYDRHDGYDRYTHRCEVTAFSPLPSKTPGFRPEMTGYGGYGGYGGIQEIQGDTGRCA